MRPNVLAPILLVLCLFATAAPVHTVDGMLEIHPACVPDGCFPGDQPGFPVEITEPGSYRLTGSLEVPDEDTTAIQVVTELPPPSTTVQEVTVTVDLNGFEIIGPTVCELGGSCSPTGSGDGIQELGSVRMTIRNGAIRGMGDDGVDIGPGLVESVHATHNGSVGIQVPSGVVRGCTASHNGSTGISVNFAVVEGNQVRSNLGDGIFCDDEALVARNAAWNNDGAGLNASGDCGYVDNSFAANNGGNSNPQGAGGFDLVSTLCGTDTSGPGPARSRRASTRGAQGASGASQSATCEGSERPGSMALVDAPRRLPRSTTAPAEPDPSRDHRGRTEEAESSREELVFSSPLEPTNDPSKLQSLPAGVATPTGAARMTVEGEIRTVDENDEPRRWGRGRPDLTVHGTMSDFLGEVPCQGEDGVLCGLGSVMVDWGSAADGCPTGTWVCRANDFSTACDTVRPDDSTDALGCDGSAIDRAAYWHGGWLAEAYYGFGGYQVEGDPILRSTQPCLSIPVWCCWQ